MTTTQQLPGSNSGSMPPSDPPPPPPPPGPVDLLPGEPVVHLASGKQTYTATTSPSYIYGNVGDDTINGGSSDLSTVDYSALKAGVTLGVGGTVEKGVNGADGTDELVDIKTIVGAAGQSNVVDATDATGEVVADLNTHTIGIENIPGLGSLSFNIYNFQTIDGPPLADTFVGDNGNDTFVGGAGSTFTSGTGHNTLTGGGSDDVFNFGGGHDIITDFSISGGDVINSAYALEHVTKTAGGSVLHFDGGGTITLLGVSAKSIAGSDAVKIT